MVLEEIVLNPNAELGVVDNVAAVAEKVIIPPLVPKTHAAITAYSFRTSLYMFPSFNPR